eukprot:350344-Chlamydomonas_euryale.AAC.2
MLCSPHSKLEPGRAFVACHLSQPKRKPSLAYPNSMQKQEQFLLGRVGWRTACCCRVAATKLQAMQGITASNA